MKIALKKEELQSLLEVLEVRQKQDHTVSNIIEIEMVQECDLQLASDKVKFYARSIYAECDNHFLGIN